MNFNGLGILRFIPQFFYSPDDGGGSDSDVTELPEVPSPSSKDLDELAGDDDTDDTDDSDVDDQDDKSNDDDQDDDQERDQDDDDDEDDDEEEGDKKKPKKKDDDVVDEDKDDEEEEQEEDKKAAKPLDKVPSIKALKTAYPDIFKKFPHVRTAIAEHQQFRNLYSSMDEAREASEDSQNFYMLRDKLLDEGDFGFVFDELSKADNMAAARMVKKILPSIMERNRDLYMDITETPIRQFVHAAYSRAKRDGNKNLENSALHLWRFLGLDGAPQQSAQREDPKDTEFQSRVKEFEAKKQKDAQGSVNREIESDLRGLIEQAIDPKGAMKGVTKSALVNQLVREIDQEIVADRNHMSRVERLWANARRSAYANGHLSRIITAYLERAKQILPKHARKVREENGITNDRNDDKAGRRQPVRRDENRPPARPQAGGAPTRPKTIRDTNPRDIDWQRTSDTDVLGGRAVLRRR